MLCECCLKHLAENFSGNALRVVDGFHFTKLIMLLVEVFIIQI